jgi:UDP-N-acetylmuramoylalanine-D-glutamate ligase
LIGKDIHARDKTLVIPGHSIDHQRLRLIGAHNYQNLAVAYYIASLYGVSDEQVKDACRKFKPLHHRLEDLGVTSMASVMSTIRSQPLARHALQALKSIRDVDTVLVGGMDRGISYAELERYLYERKDVKVIFMYATGQRILQEMKEKDLICVKVSIRWMIWNRQSSLPSKKQGRDTPVCFLRLLLPMIISRTLKKEAWSFQKLR